MVDAVSTSLGGLNAYSNRLAESAKKIANANASGTGGEKATQVNNVPNNLDEELVNSKLAEIGYSANAKVIKAQLDTQKELLDILA